MANPAIAGLLDTLGAQHDTMLAFEGMRAQLGAEAAQTFKGQEGVSIRMGAEGVRVVEGRTSNVLMTPAELVEAGSMLPLLSASIDTPEQSPNVIAFNNAVADVDTPAPQAPQQTAAPNFTPDPMG